MDILTEIQENQLENTVNGPVQTSEDIFGDLPDDLDDGVVFETSGTTGDPTPVPHTNVDHAIESVVDVYRLVGLDENDSILNFGAPEPHISGWGVNKAIERYGCRSVNNHFEDYHQVFENEAAHEVTTLFTVPKIAEAVGEKIAAKRESPSELFPDLELIICGGQIVTQKSKERLKELWGADRVRDIYATTEVGIIASTNDDTRQSVPFLHRYILEIIPDDSSDEIIDIRNVSEKREGSLLITAPDREAADITRYRIGDKVAVHPRDGIPRISHLGREDNSIDISGALLYPAQLHVAVKNAYGTDADWVVRVSHEDYPALDVYVIDGDAQSNPEFRSQLYDQNDAIKLVYEEIGSLERLDIHHVDSREDIPGLSPDSGIKKEHVLFDDSYTQMYRG
ncbi:AMP-binding protein [Salinarchaeum sp. IM2453]|uniref:AMP-binding protein n=1 Tax=Salinarchaeum sp. IM2453 TaxID=2862870 RepID=UPI001C836BE9|nr:AMP-binding protein [Salinarchaeum sp. IM2453]QZA88033.1 AMP-binding protein [Salinarchaeum sp. IM2453]